MVGSEPGALLVASVSEALARSGGSASISSSRHGPVGWFPHSQHRGVCFKEGATGRALPLALLSGATITHGHGKGSSAHATHPLLQDAAFRVQTRRTQQQVPRQIQYFLTTPLSKPADTAFQFATSLQHLLLTKLGFLLAAQHAFSQQLERSSHWRPRNPFRRGRDGERGTGASAGSSRCNRQARRWGEIGMAKEREHNLIEAAEAFQKASALDPASPEWWARESKQWSDMTFVPGTTPARAIEVNQRAIELGHKAVEADPNSVFGHTALCVSRGRLALYTKDKRAMVALARQAQDDVQRALAADPDSDLAHHLLGRWHYEMASVNAVVRTIVHMLYGASLMAGSYKNAAACFETASELRPDRLIHRVELGRSYMKLGNLSGAVQQLEEAMKLEEDDYNAKLQKEAAAELLVKLKAQQARRSR